jgi:hypothetical protein
MKKNHTHPEAGLASLRTDELRMTPDSNRRTCIVEKKFLDCHSLFFRPQFRIVKHGRIKQTKPGELLAGVIRPE